MTETLWLVLDLSLAGLVLMLGSAAVSSPDSRRAVVLFIAFGLLMALVWARLNAPDLALAEAAIGAGLTGALLLTALRDRVKAGSAAARPAASIRLLIGLLALLLAALFAWTLLRGPNDTQPMDVAGLVAAHLDDSGVSNPVTAVLLNFRAYDTLLELAVLLAAVLGVLALGSERPGYRRAGPVLEGLLHWLVPLLIVTGGYLLWVGAHAPGGAFQAGALLAAAAVLLRLCGNDHAGLPGPLLQRVALTAGIAAFVVVGSLAMIDGSAFLQYPQGWAGTLILAIETAAMLSIATTLALAYIGGQPRCWPMSPPEQGAGRARERHP